MSMWRKHKGNILDYIPLRNPEIGWREKSAGDDVSAGETIPARSGQASAGGETRVQLIITRTGLLDRFVQRVFKRPASSTVDLDKFGSFVWKQIDGERSVNDIAEEMRQEFGEEAEPLYDRLVKFLRLLRNNDFVSLYKPGK
jgi:hypothetical protein